MILYLFHGIGDAHWKAYLFPGIRFGHIIHFRFHLSMRESNFQYFLLEITGLLFQKQQWFINGCEISSFVTINKTHSGFMTQNGIHPFGCARILSFSFQCFLFSTIWCIIALIPQIHLIPVFCECSQVPSRRFLWITQKSPFGSTASGRARSK